MREQIGGTKVFSWSANLFWRLVHKHNDTRFAIVAAAFLRNYVPPLISQWYLAVIADYRLYRNMSGSFVRA